jgi:hypothetical protein
LVYDISKTPWQLFQEIGTDPSGLGDYVQAEFIAVFRAIDSLKRLPYDRTMTFLDWATDAIEFANRFPRIGAKYREAAPLLMALEDYGLVEFGGEGDLNEFNDWSKVTVRITAKGFLAQPSEYFVKKEQRR